MSNKSPPSLVISEHKTRRMFSKMNTRKVAGPYGITPRLMTHCSSQLAGIFTYIFNLSLSLCSNPRRFKESIVIPIPKKNPVKVLNDYRPVALTFVVMKSFERLVLIYLKSVLPAHWVLTISHIARTDQQKMPCRSHFTMLSLTWISKIRMGDYYLSILVLLSTQFYLGNFRANSSVFYRWLTVQMGLGFSFGATTSSKLVPWCLNL